MIVDIVIFNDADSAIDIIAAAPGDEWGLRQNGGVCVVMRTKGLPLLHSNGLTLHVEFHSRFSTITCTFYTKSAS